MDKVISDRFERKSPISNFITISSSVRIQITDSNLLLVLLLQLY
jgi:hypothetical protein